MCIFKTLDASQTAHCAGVWNCRYLEDDDRDATSGFIVVNSPAAQIASHQNLDRSRHLRQTPVWMFLGDADPSVPVTEWQKMNVALKAADGNVRYTEYPGVGHNSWDQAYEDPELAKWMFEQKLR